MAREATITQEQVNAAADAIRSSGAKPTARAIRDHLGTGSMATVLRLFQTWQASQGKAVEAPLMLPAGLQRALLDFVGQEIATAKAELQADVVALQRVNDDLIADNERQSSTIDIQAQAVELIQTEKSEMAGRLAHVESDLARAQDAVTYEQQAAESARTELAKARLQLEAVPRMEAEIERLRNELTVERHAHTDAEQKAAVAIAKLEFMTDRAAKAEAGAEKAEKQAMQASQELASARGQAQILQAALDSERHASGVVHAALVEAQANTKAALAEAAELRGKLAVFDGSAMKV